MSKTNTSNKKTALKTPGKKKPSNKPSSKPGDKKTGEKKAKKALALAEKSVRAAEKAVRASRKKLQKKAHVLSKQTKKLAAEHSTSVDRVTAKAMKVDPGASTLIQLRQQAKERQIPGYSRMNKAELLAALDSSPSR
ncbi:Rho termination factor-like protein [Glaciihabitans tibetensis]|uniref:Rho termination factor-like protein n=1 Tax=Glaciihabitans tibetensis TaxID=1266600 RepID=A0A2T0VA95_9MICO|nr:Rho termination factor N-terminal domain-containing protein [Glaciihabitans tibetensis]PRY67074.1 Rho termination factor-like protein [Glaciihabitans tibetensis]